MSIAPYTTLNAPDRTASIEILNLDATNARTTVSIVQEAEQAPVVPLPTSGILAPPGVLGVGETTGQLTLRGSTEYAGTIYAMNSDFGAPANETVYVAFFQYGSLIGTSSSTVNKTFSKNEVVWAPENYDIQALMSRMTTDGTPSWTIIPNGVGGSFPSNNVAAGIGDPCKFADGANGSGPWKTPPGSPWNGVTYTNATLPIVNLTLQGSSIPGRGTTDGKMFLPVTGFRNSSAGERAEFDGQDLPGPYGTIVPGSLTGSYWSTANAGAQYLYYGYILQFENKRNTINLSKNSSGRWYGAAVRCVSI